MRIIKLFSIIFLLVCITFGAIGGCGSSGGGDQDEELAGELICNDEIDNDNDGDTDCEDIDCILFPNCIPASCEELVAAQCDRLDDCDLLFGITFEECVATVAIFLGIICGENVESSATLECVDDIIDLSCDAVEAGVTPESCEDTLEIIGLCDECETSEDCPGSLLCFECTFECTGNVGRCAPLGVFAECVDGIFKE